MAIFNGGFRTTVPDFKEIERGQGNPKTMSENSASFVFWTGFYNVEQGDQVYLKITDPNRATFTETTKTVERTRARQYYYTGRKIGNVQLIPGTYNGFSKITRTQNGEKIIRKKSFNIEITP